MNGVSLRAMMVMACAKLGVLALCAAAVPTLALAQTGPTQGCANDGCNLATRRPFVGFWLSGRLPSSAQVWMPGGDVSAALEAERRTLNANYQYSRTWPAVCTTINSMTPVGSAPAAESGGTWRRVYANRTYTFGGPDVAASCSPPPSYQVSDTVGALSGICGEGNNTGLVTGIDDACYCPTGWDWSDDRGRCVITRDIWKIPPPGTCPGNPNGSGGSSDPGDPGQGNPIYPISGSKRQVVNLDLLVGFGSTQLVYNSLILVPYASGAPKVNGKAAFLPATSTGMGAPWSTSLHKGLAITAHAIDALRGGGRWVHFDRSGSTATPASGVRARLLATSSGWRYEDPDAGVIELYDASGQVLSANHQSGRSLSYRYSDGSTPATQAPGPGRLIGITDQDGRSVSLDLDAASRVTRITGPDGGIHRLSYDANGMLELLTWPDGRTQRFVYERGDLPWALTGVVDESGQRTSSFLYSSTGLAEGTVKHGPGGSPVDAYNVAYGTSPPGWTVIEDFSSPPVLWRIHTFTGAASLSLTTPTGATQAMTGITVNGAGRLTSQSQPAGSGCAASSSTLAWDANGSLASVDDFNGTRTCYAHDKVRNLEVTRVEGLPGGGSCSLTATGAALPLGSRKTSTQWHPNWSLKTRVAEPGRITTYVYNGQPDPYAGGTLAQCAPASALLPDGRPIAVLCRQVEQATTDVDGSAAWAATTQAGVATREQRWTYDARGRVLTHDGPRTDVADISTYDYQPTTGAGQTQGDLLRVTNAAGHVTQFTARDGAGRVLQSVDPNGVATDLRYDLRGRLISQTVAGQATLYDWWPTGLIQRITAPDGSWTFFEHDQAHRLWRVTDNLGNQVTYTLDGSGQRVGESVTDPNGVLRRQVARVMDALGRVEQVTGRE